MSAGSPSRSAPRRNVARSGSSACQITVGASIASAIVGPVTSSHETSGTRNVAPTAARRAFDPVGSAQPSESATNAGPSASAARMSVPMFPGSWTRHSASPTGASVPRGRSAWRKTPITRDGCGRVEIPAISGPSTSVAPGRRSSSTVRDASTSASTGSRPASRAATTRSSPSAANRPSRCRLPADSSWRTSLSRGLVAAVTTPAIASGSRDRRAARAFASRRPADL